MKKTITFLILLLPLFSIAQGIKFEEGLSWELVKAKAKSENKYIFVDCYATWCAPCKLMDKKVYVNDTVGRAVNPNFISLKVQMDSTKGDNAFIRTWYPIANQFKKNYVIPGFPAYLFFSPEGKLVHQEEGYKNPEKFILLINAVLDRSQQFAKVLDEYKKGVREPELVVKAAKAAKKFGYTKLADSIARAYKHSYLDLLKDDILFTKPNIQFVAQDFHFLIYEEDGVNGRFFKYFLQNSNKVDSLFHNGFADFYVKGIIINDELNKKLFKDRTPLILKPDWEAIKTDLGKKYGGKYAEKIVTEYKPFFYQATGNWRRWAVLIDDGFKSVHLVRGGKNLGNFSDDWFLNSTAWDVFEGCNDKKVLRKALKWSELSIKLKKEGQGLEQYLDTKANLLYKLGKIKKAIKLEEQALKLENEYARLNGKEKGDFADHFTETIKKMKAGTPTWKVNK